MARKRTAKTQEPAGVATAQPTDFEYGANAQPSPQRVEEIVREVEQSTRMPGDNAGQEPAPKRSFQARFGYWRNKDAGVRIEEDYKNGLTTILFRDPAPAKAQEMLEAVGYIKEGDYAFSKEIDELRRREHREEAENLVLGATNIVREGKGQPPLKSFYISRS